MTTDRRRSKLQGRQPRRVVGQLGRAQTCNPWTTEPIEEMAQIALVSDDAIFGQVAFATQIAYERLAPLGGIFRSSEPTRFDFFFGQWCPFSTTYIDTPPGRVALLWADGEAVRYAIAAQSDCAVWVSFKHVDSYGSQAEPGLQICNA